MPRNPDETDYSGGFSAKFEQFIILEDPRRGNHKRHHFGEMIFMSVSALICGVQSFSGVIEFAHIHGAWLRKWITLPNGIPVQQTFINLFALLDPVQFSQCIKEHLEVIYPELSKQLSLPVMAKPSEEAVRPIPNNSTA